MNDDQGRHDLGREGLDRHPDHEAHDRHDGGHTLPDEGRDQHREGESFGDRPGADRHHDGHDADRPETLAEVLSRTPHGEQPGDTQVLDHHGDSERTDVIDSRHDDHEPTTAFDARHDDNEQTQAIDPVRDDRAADNRDADRAPDHRPGSTAGAVGGAGAAAAAGAALSHHQSTGHGASSGQLAQPAGQHNHRDGNEPTQVMAAVDPDSDRAERERAEREAADQRERERLDALARRREEQAARDRALGTVNRDESGDATDDQPWSFTKRSTDKFLGALGLFVLRLVTAGIMAVHGYQKVTNISGTTAMFDSLGLPYASYFAWGVGIAELLAAVALVFGFMVRVVGIGVMAIAVGALVLVKWGAKNPFQAGQAGFVGELELLLAAVGFLLFCLGGGGWGMDGGVRRGRARKKAGL